MKGNAKKFADTYGISYFIMRRRTLVAFMYFVNVINNYINIGHFPNSRKMARVMATKKMALLCSMGQVLLRGFTTAFDERSVVPLSSLVSDHSPS